MGAVYTQLSLKERRRIEDWWHAKVPVREITRVAKSVMKFVATRKGGSWSVEALVCGIGLIDQGGWSAHSQRPGDCDTITLIRFEPRCHTYSWCDDYFFRAVIMISTLWSGVARAAPPQARAGA